MTSHLCPEGEFAAASLGNTFANVTGYSVMVGLSSALATLASQAYGAGDLLYVPSPACLSCPFHVVLTSYPGR
jgi:Na+-driven multidrug efflux pump